MKQKGKRKKDREGHHVIVKRNIMVYDNVNVISWGPSTLEP